MSSRSRPALRAAAACPARPLHLMMPHAAGLPSDIMALAVRHPLAEALGHSVVVENRAGGGVMIGSEPVGPDEHAYSFLFANAPHTIMPAVHPRAL